VILDAVVARWLTDNWWIVLSIEAGIVLLAFLVRCTTRVDTSGFYAGIKKRAQSLHRSARRKSAQPETAAARTDLSPRMLKVHINARDAVAVSKKRAEQLEHDLVVDGFRRLALLFPLAPFETLEAIVAASPHERAAVWRLLQLGYGLDTSVTSLLPPTGDNKVRGAVRNTHDPLDAFFGDEPHSPMTADIVQASNTARVVALEPPGSANIAAAPEVGRHHSPGRARRRAEAVAKPQRRPPTEAEKEELARRQEAVFQRERALAGLELEPVTDGINAAAFGVLVERDERGRPQSVV
jgi:hypothetical protein